MIQYLGHNGRMYNIIISYNSTKQRFKLSTPSVMIKWKKNDEIPEMVFDIFKNSEHKSLTKWVNESEK
jgi:hypothetical protein